MRIGTNKKSGFTLIELMIVVAILGILAAIAIPAFVTYVRRAKTVEATENVAKMFDAVATYYSKEWVGQAITTSMQTNCTVAAADNGVAPPSAQKKAGTYTGNSFAYVGFAVPPGYYRYEIAGSTLTCQRPPATGQYTLRALGDLDADGTSSTFEYAVASSTENELYHAAGMYVVNETE